MRIAVGPNGVPWLVNSAGQIWRRDSSDPSSGGWTQLPGGGRDISIQDGNYAWLIGGDTVPGGSSIFLWNEQPAGGGAIARSPGSRSRVPALPSVWAERPPLDHEQLRRRLEGAEVAIAMWFRGNAVWAAVLTTALAACAGPSEDVERYAGSVIYGDDHRREFFETTPAWQRSWPCRSSR